MPVLERPRERPQTDRIQTIHEMLLRYHEARSESGGTGEATGGSRLEDRIHSFDPSTWSREYVELERSLGELRHLAAHGRPMIERGVSSSAAWFAIRKRYLEADTVRREIHSRRTHGGTRVPVALPGNMEIISRQTILNGRSSFCMVRVWDQRVNGGDVQAGLRWISREYRGRPAVYEERP